MEEIIRKREIPSMPEEIKIEMAGYGALSSQTIKDISEAAKYTVLSSASSDASCRKEIEDTCMKTLLTA